MLLLVNVFFSVWALKYNAAQYKELSFVEWLLWRGASIELITNSLAAAQAEKHSTQCNTV